MAVVAKNLEASAGDECPIHLALPNGRTSARPFGSTPLPRSRRPAAGLRGDGFRS